MRRNLKIYASSEFYVCRSIYHFFDDARADETSVLYFVLYLILLTPTPSFTVVLLYSYIKLEGVFSDEVSGVLPVGVLKRIWEMGVFS